MNRERIAELEEKYLDEHPGTAGTVEPYVYNDPAISVGPGRFPFPIITEHLLSDDWEPTEQNWFVDSSGFGQRNERALTLDDFRAQLIEYIRKHPDHGFALSGAGQFQVCVTAYRKKI